MKNSGLVQEIEWSKSFHRESVPILVSSALLRERQLGQIDLARLRKDRDGWLLELAEVKSSEVGEAALQGQQQRRLFSSQLFLSQMFGHRSRLVRLTAK